MMRKLFILASWVIATPVLAQQQQISLNITTQAVKKEVDKNGVTRNVLVEPKVVVPGQPLVYTITMKNNTTKPASNLVINNPVPNNVIFTGFGPQSQTGLTSVDGGKTFGQLSVLQVKGKDGKMRKADFKDVTHVRWVLAKPLAGGASNQVIYFGVVE
jgi:uncharacterized repeat protein (TIGR01451 family)